jgi:hypothetical protein
MQQINADVGKTTQIDILSLMPSLWTSRLSDTLIEAAKTVAEVYSLLSRQVHVITITVVKSQEDGVNIFNTEKMFTVMSNISNPKNPTLIINSNDNSVGKVDSIAISNADGTITITPDATVPANIQFKVNRAAKINDFLLIGNKMAADLN